MAIGKSVNPITGKERFFGFMPSDQTDGYDPIEAERIEIEQGKDLTRLNQDKPTAAEAQKEAERNRQG